MPKRTSRSPSCPPGSWGPQSSSCTATPEGTRRYTGIYSHIPPSSCMGGGGGGGVVKSIKNKIDNVIVNAMHKKKRKFLSGGPGGTFIIIYLCFFCEAFMYLF